MESLQTSQASAHTFQNDNPEAFIPVEASDPVMDAIKTGLIGDDEAETYRVLQAEEAKSKEAKALEEKRLIEELMNKHMHNYKNALASTFDEIMEGKVNNGEQKQQ